MPFIYRLYDFNSEDIKPPYGAVYSTTVPKAEESAPFPMGSAARFEPGVELVWKNDAGAALATISIEVSGKSEIGYPEFLAELDDLADIDLYEAGSVLVKCAFLWLRNRGYAYAFSHKSLSEFSVSEFQSHLDLGSRGDLESRFDPTLDNADILVDTTKWNKISTPVLRDPSNRPLFIRHAESSEREILVQWIDKEFGSGWASEVASGFNGGVPSVIICSYQRDTFAKPEDHFVGFVCYDTRRLGLATTIGVRHSVRGHGVANSLVDQLILSMNQSGYRWAVLGGVDRKRRTLLQHCQYAIDIPNSGKSIFGRAVRS